MDHLKFVTEFGKLKKEKQVRVSKNFTDASIAHAAGGNWRQVLRNSMAQCNGIEKRIYKFIIAGGDDAIEKVGNVMAQTSEEL